LSTVNATNCGQKKKTKNADNLVDHPDRRHAKNNELPNFGAKRSRHFRVNTTPAPTVIAIRDGDTPTTPVVDRAPKPPVAPVRIYAP